MRVAIVIVLLALAACTSHEVRCDRHLQQINPAAATAAVVPPSAS